ncbi:MAG: hypothetical protein PHV85_00265 [Desulfovibrionaceae bacterium]|nr:hypothetical protein [Desulfovibrionaceae bacterium]
MNPKHPSHKWLNVLLVLAGIVLPYLVLEAGAFKALLPRLPRSQFNFMAPGLRVLGQTSKNGLLPRPGYVAITGDSYAQGKGDWFIDQGYDRSTEYQAAHLVHRDLGLDVVSFGRSGAGSVDGAVLEPLQDLAFLRGLGLEAPNPGIVLVYFYEGNDLENNLWFLENWYRKGFGGSYPLTRAGFRTFLERMAAKYARGEPRGPGERLIFGSYLLRLVKAEVLGPLARDPASREPEVPAGKTNRALVGDTVLALPDRLQAPPVYMDQTDLDRGLFVFEQSALFLRDRLKGPEVILVYIPAPLSCYDLACEEVSTFYGGEHGETYPAGLVNRVSGLMIDRLRAFAEKNGFAFVNAKKYLVDAGRRAPVHGPRDWDHLNRAGYQALARAIEHGLAARRTATP